MIELQEEEMKQIKGGGISIWGGIGIATGIIFLIGVIDGFVRPLKCN
jgi:lactobin A/cerein 7B family class IIb bacteriocin